MQRSDEITAILQAIRAGDRTSEDQLVGLVYADLRSVARRYMAREQSEHTLQPTALVNEVFLRLFRTKQAGDERVAPVDWQNRAHFLAVAARQMRRILIDHARQKRAEKRGFGLKTSIEDIGLAAAPSQPFHDFDTINLLLDTLSKKDPAAAQVVELKFFGGLTDREAAVVMGTSDSQVRRHWTFARAWLRRHLQDSKNVE
jgi:RNA polymerase sigma factor (TIGR02999 family)